MRVDPLIPDAPPALRLVPSTAAAQPFAQLVDAAGAILAGAQRAEDAFAAHRGGVQEMVVERARADVALQIAATGAQRATQALATILGMQL